jgi:hypothetical protein
MHHVLAVIRLNRLYVRSRRYHLPIERRPAEEK